MKPHKTCAHCTISRILYIESPGHCWTRRLELLKFLESLYYKLFTGFRCCNYNVVRALRNNLNYTYREQMQNPITHVGPWVSNEISCTKYLCKF